MHVCGNAASSSYFDVLKLWTGLMTVQEHRRYWYAHKLVCGYIKCTHSHARLGTRAHVRAFVPPPPPPPNIRTCPCLSITLSLFSVPGLYSTSKTCLTSLNDTSPQCSHGPLDIHHCIRGAVSELAHIRFVCYKGLNYY